MYYSPLFHELPGVVTSKLSAMTDCKLLFIKTTRNIIAAKYTSRSESVGHIFWCRDEGFVPVINKAVLIILFALLQSMFDRVTKTACADVFLTGV